MGRFASGGARLVLKRRLSASPDAFSPLGVREFQLTNGQASLPWLWFDPVAVVLSFFHARIIERLIILLAWRLVRFLVQR